MAAVIRAGAKVRSLELWSVWVSQMDVDAQGLGLISMEVDWEWSV